MDHRPKCKKQNQDFRGHRAECLPVSGRRRFSGQDTKSTDLKEKKTETPDVLGGEVFKVGVKAAGSVTFF